MNYLTAPTSKLPNGRVVLEEDFVKELVETVNTLIDETRSLRNALRETNAGLSLETTQRIEGDSAEAGARTAADAKLADNALATETAVSKMAEAIAVLLKGDNL